MAVTTGDLARGKATATTAVWSSARIFLLALVLQLFHLLEHIVQVAQAKFLGIKPAHGILGSLFDLEWVHFIYNWGLYVLLIVAAIVVVREGRLRAPLGWMLLGATIAFQTYHVVEHTVKIAQHISTGIDPAPGILGQIYDLIWLHFDFNVIVTVGMLASFFALGLNKELNFRRRG